MKFIIIILVIYSGLLVACKQEGNKTVTNLNEKNQIPIQTKDTSIVKEILIESDYNFDKTKKNFQKVLPYIKGKPNSIIASSFETVKSANLVNLRNGFDSLYIRIFYEYSFEPTYQIIEIYKDQKSWKAYYTVATEKYKKGDSVPDVKKVIHKLTPISSWEKFTQDLFQLQILTLPDGWSTPSYMERGSVSDGNSVFLELSSKKMYRLYGYDNPSSHPDNSEARKMLEIIRFLEKELGVKSFKVI
jgi:hypothetical protein